MAARHSGIQFLDRPMDDEIAFLITDEPYFKVRNGATYVSGELLLALGWVENTNKAGNCLSAQLST
jgi:transposase-like protein